MIANFLDVSVSVCFLGENLPNEDYYFFKLVNFYCFWICSIAKFRKKNPNF